VVSPYSTCEVEGSSVVQKILEKDDPIEEADTEDITGPVVSALEPSLITRSSDV
jgi:hypothetical protein